MDDINLNQSDPINTPPTNPSNPAFPESHQSDYFPPQAPSTPSNKFVNGKVIATFFGMLLMVGGITAGILLVKQPAIFNNYAQTLTTNYACTGSATLSCSALGGTVGGGSCSGYGTCHLGGDYTSCTPNAGTNTCTYVDSRGTNCTAACPATMPAGYANCHCNNGVWTIGYLPAGGSCDQLCNCTGNTCTSTSCNSTTPGPGTRTPSPLPRTPSPTPSPTPSLRTPTPSPIVSSCINWANNETSGEKKSDLVKINAALNQITLVKTQSAATTGNYEIEAMDSNPISHILYAYSQTSTTKGLYTVNTNPSDTIPDGTLTNISTLSIQSPLTDLSFRRSDNSVWAWVKGKGIYKVNLSTGLETLVLASTLDNMEGMAWDNSSQYLYLSRTPVSSPINATHELWRYNPSTNSLAFYAPLPHDTDDLDWAPAGYLGGYLVGEYYTSTSAVFYTYDVVNKRVVNSYPIASTYKNLDAMAICINQ